jgi:hypothetical protein
LAASGLGVDLAVTGNSVLIVAGGVGVLAGFSGVHPIA